MYEECNKKYSRVTGFIDNSQQGGPRREGMATGQLPVHVSLKVLLKGTRWGWRAKLPRFFDIVMRVA
jgi:hypothetical protein